MNADLIHEKIFLAVKQHIPKNKTAVKVLMDLFSLSRESVYRRLRGEIPFTLNEFIKISSSLGISIDDLIDSGKITTKWVTLNPDKFYLHENYVAQYCGRLNEYIALFKQMQSAKRARIRCVNDYIPDTFMLSHKKLCQLRHYKWNFLAKGVKSDFSLSKIVMPDELVQAEKHFVEEFYKTPRVTYILDKDIFLSIINDINFFVSQKLIHTHELIQLKQELLDVISEIETLTDTGFHKNGMEVSIYLSKINVDGAYFHVEFDEEVYCMQRIFFIERLEFNNSKFCKKQKDWMDSLKRYSTLLTESGDRQRFNFFDEQRRLVRNLVMPTHSDL